MNKIASSQVNQTMLKAASLLRGQQTELDYLRNELAIRDRRGHAQKIASAAVEKGIMEEEEASEYADSLVSGDRDLDMVEEFVSRTTHGVPLGSSLKKTASASSNEADMLTSYLLSNEIP